MVEGRGEGGGAPHPPAPPPPPPPPPPPQATPPQPSPPAARHDHRGHPARRIRFPSRARVDKLAKSADLKSVALRGSVGSTPTPGMDGGQGDLAVVRGAESPAVCAVLGVSWWRRSLRGCRRRCQSSAR